VVSNGLELATGVMSEQDFKWRMDVVSENSLYVKIQAYFKKVFITCPFNE
jgi:hypothetical protein